MKRIAILSLALSGCVPTLEFAGVPTGAAVVVDTIADGICTGVSVPSGDDWATVFNTACNVQLATLLQTDIDEACSATVVDALFVDADQYKVWERACVPI